MLLSTSSFSRPAPVRPAPRASEADADPFCHSRPRPRAVGAALASTDVVAGSSASISAVLVFESLGACTASSGYERFAPFAPVPNINSRNHFRRTSHSSRPRCLSKRLAAGLRAPADVRGPDAELRARPDVPASNARADSSCACPVLPAASSAHRVVLPAPRPRARPPALARVPSRPTATRSRPAVAGPARHLCAVATASPPKSPAVCAPRVRRPRPATAATASAVVPAARSARAVPARALSSTTASPLARPARWAERAGLVGPRPPTTTPASLPKPPIPECRPTAARRRAVSRTRTLLPRASPRLEPRSRSRRALPDLDHSAVPARRAPPPAPAPAPRPVPRRTPASTSRAVPASERLGERTADALASAPAVHRWQVGGSTRAVERRTAHAGRCGSAGLEWRTGPAWSAAGTRTTWPWVGWPARHPWRSRRGPVREPLRRGGSTLSCLFGASAKCGGHAKDAFFSFLSGRG